MKIGMIALLLLCVQTAAAEWNITDAAIAVKVLNKGNRHSYEALKSVEQMVKLNDKDLVSYSFVKHQFPPMSSDHLVPEVSLDFKGISIPAGGMLNNLYGISEEAQNSMYQRLTNLKEKYNDSATPPNQRELIGSLFQDYFKLDLSKSGEEIISSGDVDLTELKERYDSNKDLEATLTNEVWDAAKAAVNETEIIVGKATDKMNKKTEEEAQGIQKTLENTTAPIKSTGDENKTSLLYLTERARAQEFNEQINLVGSATKMQELINRFVLLMALLRLLLTLLPVEWVFGLLPVQH